MGVVGEAYAACRNRIIGLAAALDDHDTDRLVPTCPGWSVRDVVAHVAGVVDDVLAGRIEGVATEPWTAAQVESGRQRPLGEVINRWCADAPLFEGFLDTVGPRGRQAVTDIVTHEHDIRCALGRPGARDSDAVTIGLSFVATAFVDNAGERGIVVRVSSTTGESFGTLDAPVAVTAPPFELLRAITGRRSERQLLDLAWTGDAAAALPAFVFGPFQPAAEDVTE